MSRSKKINRSRKTRKTKKGKSRRYRKTGGTNCKSFTLGGSKPFSGGNLAPYQLNNHVNDPNIIDARQLPNISETHIKVGGRSRKQYNKLKKMKGGNMIGSFSDFLLGTNTSSNTVLSFGTLPSAALSTRILAGAPPINSAPYVQPISTLFSSTNPPLV